MAAHVRKRRRHHRQVPARHEDRALLEIQVERGLDLLVHHTEIQQEVRDRPVAVAGGAFRFVDGPVHLERPPSQRAESIEQMIECAAAMLRVQERRHRDRPGVHHRIVRPVGFSLQLDGIERVSARFHVNALEHLFRATFFERHSEHERLRDRLDRELSIAVAGFKDSARGSDQRYAKFVWICLAQFGNVGRDLAVVDQRVSCLQLVDKRLYFLM
jgi:hypothetical protein